MMLLSYPRYFHSSCSRYFPYPPGTVAAVGTVLPSSTNSGIFAPALYSCCSRCRHFLFHRCPRYFKFFPSCFHSTFLLEPGSVYADFPFGDYYLYFHPYTFERDEFDRDIMENKIRFWKKGLKKCYHWSTPNWGSQRSGFERCHPLRGGQSPCFSRYRPFTMTTTIWPKWKRNSAKP